MQEKRCCSRKKLDNQIQAIDSNTMEPLGILANISREGFMLIGNQRIEPANVFQLILELAQPIDGVNTIECGAESLWSDTAADDSLNWSGFQIIDISDDDAKLIAQRFDLAED